jgi:probable phosphoglycerate mutase
MGRIFLVRHGETDWNRERRVLGWSRVSLNDAGVAQARELAALLPIFKIAAIYTSPLPRTLETARILGASLGLEPVVDPHFTESNVGDWEGRFWQELEDDPVRLRYYTHPTTARPPGGETYSEVQRRAVDGTVELFRRQPEEPLLIVSHADLIRTVLAHYLGLDMRTARQFRIDHASVSAFSTDGKSVVLHFLNWVADRSRSERR